MCVYTKPICPVHIRLFALCRKKNETPMYVCYNFVCMYCTYRYARNVYTRIYGLTLGRLGMEQLTYIFSILPIYTTYINIFIVKVKCHAGIYDFLSDMTY